MDNYDNIPDQFKHLQRKDVPNIEDILIGKAIIWSLMSKDPSTQVAASIYSTDNRELTSGYNGTPVGWPDDEFPWGKGYEGEDKKYEKYNHVIHAEDNAIRNFLNHNGDPKELIGSTIFVTLFPCSNCAKILVEHGIKKVVYFHDFYFDKPDTIFSKDYLRQNGVEFEQFQSKDIDSITISLNQNVPSQINWKDGRQRGRK